MPVVMLQLFSYLYQSNFDFQTVCLSPEFLTGLIDLLVISNVCQTSGVTQAEASEEVFEFSWHRLDELLLSFLRTIVVDSFSLPPTAHRPVHVVDTVLEVGFALSQFQTQKFAICWLLFKIEACCIFHKRHP